MNGVQTSRFLGRREPEVQGRAPTCHSSRQVIAKIIRSGVYSLAIPEPPVFKKFGFAFFTVIILQFFERLVKMFNTFG